MRPCSIWSQKTLHQGWKVSEQHASYMFITQQLGASLLLLLLRSLCWPLQMLQDHIKPSTAFCQHMAATAHAMPAQSISAGKGVVTEHTASCQQQQQQQGPDGVLDLVADLHMFELQLGLLRQRAHELAADRALIAQQLQQHYLQQAQESPQ